jgi:hypothetical protein
LAKSKRSVTFEPRIYTEDLNRKPILRLTSKKFESFTLQLTTGYSQGRAENSILLEIVEARKEDVAALAKNIRKLNGQKSVLIMCLSGKAEKID